MPAVFVTELDIEKPGTYWVLAEPVGGTKKIQAVGNVVVKDKPAAPAVGDPAPASKTPTLGNATLKQLTTAKAPDRELYGTSVADALRAHEPFVVAFATPAYCTSRTCGPVVDVVSRSAGRTRAPASGSSTSRSTRATTRRTARTAGSRSGSSSEPWVFLVGEDGRIKDRFEGTVSVRELDAAVDEHLVG